MHISINFIIHVSILLGISIYGIVSFKRLTIPFKWLTGLMIVTSISEISTRLLIFLIRNSSSSYHFYIPIEYTCYYLIYKSLRNKIKDHALTRVIFNLIMLSVFLNSILIQTVFVFPSYAISLTHLHIFFLSLLYFRELINKDFKKDITRVAEFWLNTSVLISSGSIVTGIALLNLAIRKKYDTSILHHFSFYSTIISNVLLGFSIYLNSKNRLNDA
jgi:hypothetical protein